MNEAQQTFYYLIVSLAIGLLIGIERGWKQRDAEEGTRAAGLRTYGLIGLLGGVMALLSKEFGAILLGISFFAVTLMLTAVYYTKRLENNSDAGITSLVAALVTFALGATAALGEIIIASGIAVISALLLSQKPQLHGWLHALKENEIKAGIKLLIISVVLLPILPNRGYGPWDAFNPYLTWWMVVLISGISFFGYFAVKISGTNRGIIYTGFFGGLASSTALTLHFSRMAGRNQDLAPALAIGTLIACGTVFPRLLLVVSILNINLLPLLLLPAFIMALIIYLPFLWYWKYLHNKINSESPLKNPLELKSALIFGIFLSVILLLGKALQEYFGNRGILILAGASGIADVDAITLSLAIMSADSLNVKTAAMGIILAASVNNLVKAGMALASGGRNIGLRVGLPLSISAIGGPVSLWLWAF